jgi:hypothetical protein
VATGRDVEALSDFCGTRLVLCLRRCGLRRLAFLGADGWVDLVVFL